MAYLAAYRHTKTIVSMAMHHSLQKLWQKKWPKSGMIAIQMFSMIISLHNDYLKNLASKDVEEFIGRAQKSIRNKYNIECLCSIKFLCE